MPSTVSDTDGHGHKFEARDPRPIARARGWIRDNRAGVLVLAAVGVGVYGWSWWRGLGLPHRVGDVLYGPTIYGIVHGQIVVGGSESGHGDIVVSPVGGGHVHTLVPGTKVRSATRQSTGAQPYKTSVPMLFSSDIWVTGRGPLYKTYVPVPPPDRLSATALIGMVGSFGAVGGATAARPIRYAYRDVTMSEIRGARPARMDGDYSLWRKPLAEGSRTILVANHLNSVTYAAGDSVYWIESRQWKNTPPSIKQTLRNGVLTTPILPSCSRLFRASVEGGDPEMVVDRTGGIDPSELFAGESGVFWFERRTSGLDWPRTLAYLDNRQHTPLRLAEYYADACPTRCGDRLYWLEPSKNGRPLSTSEYEAYRPQGMTGQTASSAPADYKQFRVMSSALDLSSIRAEATLAVRGRLTTPSNAPVGNTYLFAHRGRVYVLCIGSVQLSGEPGHEREANGKSGSESAAAVYQVLNQGQPIVRQLAVFPARVNAFYRDDGDLYAVTTEERENWFDWSSQGLLRKFARVAYRYRLPD
jgi:hypothetical protein